jgi:hypothetical protein
MAWFISEISSFLGWWPLLFNLEWWEPSLSMGCMVPQSFAAGGNRSYLKFWVVIGGPQYPGYITPRVAPEPSVERVARAGHSTVGGIGTHMVL